MSFYFQLILFTLFSSPLSWGNETKLYLGKNSTETSMEFETSVLFSHDTSQPSIEKQNEVIETQIKYLFGTLKSKTTAGAPKSNHTIKIVSEPFQISRGLWKVNYHYNGTVLLENGPDSEISFFLPINPETIWDKGYVSAGVDSWAGKIFYPCADPHYQIEQYFWYFWNPENEGCPFVVGKDFLEVKAKIQRSPNSKSSYPEYKNLIDPDGTITTVDLFGMNDDSMGGNPHTSLDINANNYRAVHASLISRGFKAHVLTTNDLISRKMIPVGSHPRNGFIEVLSKDSGRAKQVVYLFFGSSSPYGTNLMFHYLVKYAMENASIFIFNGHSQLGESLDLKTIESKNGLVITPPTDRYQIYFFNSCSSYPYYNDQFLNRKVTESDPKGTKHLDILTNGLETLFSVIGSANEILFSAVDSWVEGTATTSYEELARDIDSYNLFGVNGDEDNEVP